MNNPSYFGGNSNEDNRPKAWWRHLKKNQKDGMISSERVSPNWETQFKQLYTEDERDSMTPVERNRAIKEIIDSVSIRQGDKDAHDSPLGVEGGINKED